MITEQRRVVFGNESLLAAVSAIFRQRGESAPPKAHAEFIHSRNGRGEPVTLLIYSDEDGQTIADFRFNAQELAAAMILFCIQSGIPLPKSYNKFVEIFDERLALIVEDSASHAARVEATAEGAAPKEDAA